GQLIGKKRESRPILWGAYALFALDLLIAFTPSFPVVGPGMEVRFGGFFSVFWTVVTTAVTTGSVNTSLSTVNPMVILSALNGLLIHATPCGKGLGVMYMIVSTSLTVLI